MDHHITAAILAKPATESTIQPVFLPVAGVWGSKTAIGHGLFRFQPVKAGDAYLEGLSMKLTFAALMGLGLAVAPAAFADPAKGEAIYLDKCKMCHDAGLANAPLKDKLAALENDRILEALNKPVPMMQAIASGLSDEEKREVTVFLTKKGLPAKDGLPEVKPGR
jgi:cytochrome c553